MVKTRKVWCVVKEGATCVWNSLDLRDSIHVIRLRNRDWVVAFREASKGECRYVGAIDHRIPGKQYRMDVGRDSCDG